MLQKTMNSVTTMFLMLQLMMCFASSVDGTDANMHVNETFLAGLDELLISCMPPTKNVTSFTSITVFFNGSSTNYEKIKMVSIFHTAHTFESGYTLEGPYAYRESNITVKEYATYPPSSATVVITICSTCTKCSDAGVYTCEASGHKNTSEFLWTESVSAKGTCEPGFYCETGEEAPASPCSVCPLYHVCSGDNNGPILCPGGTIVNAAKDACLLCPAGNTCKDGGAVINQCPQGHYCLLGSYDPLPCPYGSYSNSTNGEALDVCEPCPVGYYCSIGSILPTPCPLGTFGNESLMHSLNECLPCSPGNYCPYIGMSEDEIMECAAGYYCGLGSSTPTNNECPSGHFCPNGSSVPKRCLPGTYQPASKSRACLTCSAGFFCRDGVNQEICPTDHSCPEGSYQPISCPAGTYINVTQEVTICEDCPIGYYCTENASDPNACHVGTYGNGTNLGYPHECEPCPSGKYCPNMGMTNADLAFNCEAGFYCVEGSTSSTAEKCPKGHFCPEGSGSPQPCAEGMFQPSDTSSSCLLCSEGFYCWNATREEDCPAGSYCPSGSKEPITCPAGYSCPLKVGNPIPCTPGWYADGIGFSNCLICRAGFYCPDSSGSPISCPVEGDSDEGQLSCTKSCPIGHFCPYNTDDPIACPNGTFNAFASLVVTSCYSCPIGHYCPNAREQPQDCPMGTYNVDVNQTTCTNCPEGHHCSDKDTVPEVCPPGTYASDSQVACTECPAGTYATTFANIACNDCPKDFFCSSKSDDPIPCPTGYFCPKWSESPIECTNGSNVNHCFNDNSGHIETATDIMEIALIASVVLAVTLLTSVALTIIIIRIRKARNTRYEKPLSYVSTTNSSLSSYNDSLRIYDTLGDVMNPSIDARNSQVKGSNFFNTRHTEDPDPDYDYILADREENELVQIDTGMHEYLELTEDPITYDYATIENKTINGVVHTIHR